MEIAKIFKKILSIGTPPEDEVLYKKVIKKKIPNESAEKLTFMGMKKQITNMFTHKNKNAELPRNEVVHSVKETAKKAPDKKTTAKKKTTTTATKTSTRKKPAVKKEVTKTSPSTAKKPTTKKPTTKKTVAKKKTTVATKTTAKKSVEKKVTAKKVVAKKNTVSPKKPTTKKTIENKKTTTSKATTKKPATKKVTEKKTATKAPTKTATEKTTSTKKSVAKNVIAKKPATKKTVAKKVIEKKTKSAPRGAKKAAKIALYVKDITKHYGEVDEDFLAIIVKNLGSSIYRKDAELVSCSDPKELDTVRKNFLIKKLDINAGQKVLDAAIQDVCEELKGTRTKYRATFYYRLAKKFKKESFLS